jgi:hypothetical protein
LRICRCDLISEPVDACFRSIMTSGALLLKPTSSRGGTDQCAA